MGERRRGRVERRSGDERGKEGRDGLILREEDGQWDDSQIKFDLRSAEEARRKQKTVTSGEALRKELTLFAEAMEKRSERPRRAGRGL